MTRWVIVRCSTCETAGAANSPDFDGTPHEGCQSSLGRGIWRILHRNLTEGNARDLAAKYNQRAAQSGAQQPTFKSQDEVLEETAQKLEQALARIAVLEAENAALRKPPLPMPTAASPAPESSRQPKPTAVGPSKSGRK